MIWHSRISSLAVMAAAMSMTTSAAVGIHTAREREKKSRTIKISASEGETVTFVATSPQFSTKDRHTSQLQQENKMFKNEHAHGRSHVRQNLKALDKRQQRDDKISAAQAKRDRRAAKRAAIAGQIGDDAADALSNAGVIDV